MQVLFEELYYPPGRDDGLRVICISQPLVGRLPRLEASSTATLLSHASEDGLAGFKTAMECEVRRHCE